MLRAFGGRQSFTSKSGPSACRFVDECFACGGKFAPHELLRLDGYWLCKAECWTRVYVARKYCYWNWFSYSSPRPGAGEWREWMEGGEPMAAWMTDGEWELLRGVSFFDLSTAFRRAAMLDGKCMAAHRRNAMEGSPDFRTPP